MIATQHINEVCDCSKPAHSVIIIVNRSELYMQPDLHGSGQAYYLLYGSLVVVQSWSITHNTNRSEQADGAVDPQKYSIEDESHVFPVFHRLKRAKRNNYFHSSSLQTRTTGLCRLHTPPRAAVDQFRSKTAFCVC